jgi:hypothetical protein
MIHPLSQGLQNVDMDEPTTGLINPVFRISLYFRIFGHIGLTNGFLPSMNPRVVDECNDRAYGRRCA